MAAFTNAPWLDYYHSASTGLGKRVIYRIARRLLSWQQRAALSSQTLDEFKPHLVIGPRGFPLETRRAWGSANVPLSDATILVQGTGTGWDVISWAALRPRRIIATDLFSFEDSWHPVADYCKERFRVEVEFRQAPLEDHSFLADGSVDLCGSDAVFEHCRDLGSVLRETHRLLKPGGALYASYGPLWFCAGGDHFSGRGGIQHRFNHVLLDPSAYQDYFKSQLECVEDFQSGGRYVELDLFSKLTTAEYLESYRAAGFRLDSLILEVGRDALAFKRRFPDRFAALARRWAPRCAPDDFLIKANLVRLSRIMTGEAITEAGLA
jgi:SAM-dependent methyltransferase